MEDRFASEVLEVIGFMRLSLFHLDQAVREAVLPGRRKFLPPPPIEARLAAEAPRPVLRLVPPPSQEDAADAEPAA